MVDISRKANILVVEDDETVRKTCVRLLTTLGHKVTPAASAEAGVALVRQQTFDLLLTDIHLPGQSGDSLIRQLRQEQPDLVALIMTGYPTMELAIDAVEQGVYSFITKPFQLVDLRNAVNEALKRRDESRQRSQDQFARSLLEMERDLGDAFDLGAAIDDLLGRSRTETEVAPPAPAAAAADEPPPAPAAAAPAGKTAPADTEPLYVVVCEPVPRDRDVLRRSPSYCHFRTIYAAHKVLNAQILEQELPVEVKLVMAGHSADIPRHFRQHSRQIACVVFGPNLPRLTEATLRMTANSGGGRHVVVCYNPDQTNFSWDDLEDLSERMEIYACPATVDEHEVREFWTRYVSGELRPLIEARARGEAFATGDQAELRDRLARDDKAVELLPGFPHICRQVIEAIDAGRRFPDVARILEPDGGLQVSILRTANQTRYGARQRIESVPTALSMIGMEEARKIIMGRAMGELIRKVTDAGFDTRGFFCHSSAVGYLCQLLTLNLQDPSARQREIIDSLRIPDDAAFALRQLGLWRKLKTPENFDAFIAGILHDTGKILNAVCYPDTVPAIMREYEHAAWKGGMLTAEASVVGDFQHPASGAALLERWEVFPELVEPIRQHHEAGDAAESTSMALTLANGLAKMLHPFPRAITPAATEGGEETPSGGRNNPIPQAYEPLSAAFQEFRDDTVSPEEFDSGQIQPETLEILHGGARRVVTEADSATADLWTALGHQNPEIVALCKRLQVSAEELVRLVLLLEPYVDDLVNGLLQGVDSGPGGSSR